MKAIIINDQKRNKSSSTDNRVKDRKGKKSVRIREMTKHIRRIKANNIYYSSDWHKYIH